MRQRRPQSGVSLIEAMVALAVMAFGTLAVLGVQTTLRLNADVAKQRNEAVRLAQEALEAFRGTVTLDAYDALAGGTAAVAGDNANFTVRRVIRDAQVNATDPRRKTLTVEVSWTDRSGQGQSVRLGSEVHGSLPALAGSLAIPADQALTRNPGGRNAVIPPGAVPFGVGSSKFTPPGGGTLGWVFNNVSGHITQLCSGESCVAMDARLLAGYVQFATSSGVAPTPAEAEVPPGFAAVVGVEVAQTAPAVATIGCYVTAPSVTSVQYYCAVPVGMGSAWSGRARVTGLSLATDLADVTASRHRVCRYTPVRGCQPTVGSVVWGTPGSTLACSGSAPTPSRKLLNADHPLDYVDVPSALTNQNFLVVRAGNDSEAYTCPADDSSTPHVNGNTWHHQPAS